MKKIQGLGTALTKDEQKKISGGGQMVCTCSGTMLTVVCSYSSFGGALSCSANAVKYCNGQGYSSVSCNYGSGPQK